MGKYMENSHDHIFSKRGSLHAVANNINYAIQIQKKTRKGKVVTWLICILVGIETSFLYIR